MGARATSTAIATTAAAVLAAAGAAVAAGGPDRAGLRPADSGHWQAKAGLPDARGNARQALVRTVDGSDEHPEVARITGFGGRPPSAIGRIGFAVAGEDVGIIPCIRIAYVAGDGSVRELMITTRSMRAEPGPEAGWTRYVFDGALPGDGSVREIELGLHAEDHPPEPVRVRFDDVLVGDARFTHAGDAGHAPRR